jgi:phage-related protein
MKRRISWVGRSLKDFQGFPVAVQDQITFALQLAASGATPDNAKPMKGLGTGVFEIALRHRTDAYRACMLSSLVTPSMWFKPFRKNRSRESRHQSRTSM